MSHSLRSLPAVHVLVDRVECDARCGDDARARVADAARVVLDRVRRSVLEDEGVVPSVDELIEQTLDEAERMAAGPLPHTVNATGILLHTGLGRSPLPRQAIMALIEAARWYVPVELEMASGKRGRRTEIVREILCRLTGAESATVVNNNAAAVVLALSAMASGRTVLVSRGELVEIGGSFRLPDVMSAGGATLREVGTTNRTRLSDYERAIDNDVAALMKVHPSNFRIEGFTTDVSIERMVELGRRYGVPVIHDVGSGLLRRGGLGSVSLDEPDVATSVSAGADVVAFSGDKLLGGPQAGILVGRTEWIRRIESHPLMRAMRLDKLRLAALAATLGLHRDAKTAGETIPALRLCGVSCDELRTRAESIAEQVSGSGVEAEVVETTSYLGGGSIPAKAQPSVAVSVRRGGMTPAELARALRLGRPGVVGRVHKGSLLLDLRSVFSSEDEMVVEAVRKATEQPVDDTL